MFECAVVIEYFVLFSSLHQQQEGARASNDKDIKDNQKINTISQIKNMMYERNSPNVLILIELRWWVEPMQCLARYYHTKHCQILAENYMTTSLKLLNQRVCEHNNNSHCGFQGGVSAYIYDSLLQLWSHGINFWGTPEMFRTHCFK